MTKKTNEEELSDLLDMEEMEKHSPSDLFWLWIIVAILIALFLTPMQFWFIIALFIAIGARLKVSIYWLKWSHR